MSSNTSSSKLAAANDLLRPLVIALACGAGAAFLVYLYLQRTITEVSGGQMTPAVFAAANIDSGKEITEHMLAVEQVPAKYLHLQAVPADDKRFLIGQTTSSKIPEGQAVLWTDIKLEETPTLADRLEPNQRAFTLPTSTAAGINSLIRPGDRIDIFTTFTQRNEPGSDTASQTITRLLLQNVTVLAVNSQMDIDSATPPTSVQEITLRVNADEALLLGFAEARSNLKIMVRGRDDILTTEDVEVSLQDLMHAGQFVREHTMEESEPGSAAEAPPDFPIITEGGRQTGSGFFQDPQASQVEPMDADPARSLLEEMQIDPDSEQGSHLSDQLNEALRQQQQTPGHTYPPPSPTPSP